LEEGQWSSVIGMYERPHRIEVFMKLAEDMTDQEYWENLGWIWMDSENLHQYSEHLEDLINPSDRPLKLRHTVMDGSERSVLVGMSDPVRIYRGATEINIEGWSWTISSKVAKRFARRYADIKKGVSILLKAYVPKEHVIWYLKGRNEEEIVTKYEHVENMEIVEL